MYAGEYSMAEKLYINPLSTKQKCVCCDVHACTSKPSGEKSAWTMYIFFHWIFFVVSDLDMIHSTYSFLHNSFAVSVVSGRIFFLVSILNDFFLSVLVNSIRSLYVLLKKSLVPRYSRRSRC